MPLLDHNDKVTCGNCGTQNKKPNLDRHKKRCSASTLYCTQCLNFSTTSQDDINHHIAKNHSASKLVVTLICNPCCQESPGFHALRQRKNTQHGLAIKTAIVDPDDIINEVDDANPEEELRSCQNFLLNSELERAN